ncbi:hypothetical protein [Flagellimonas sp.]|uniref:hypothetical protein n=1 Tax=Flagellimonas sp. TaxID=2058762 RepID=UPI003F4A2B5E
MSVPATENGLEVELVAPNVSADQRLAIAHRNGEPLERPEYADIPTNFGPDHDYDGVPYIPGAIWTFPEPPAAGRGFDFTFERLGRPITTGTFGMGNFQEPAEIFGGGIDDIIVQNTSMGQGYTNSPQLTIEDPTGSGATAEAHIAFAITGLTLTDPGSGFLADENVVFSLRYDEIENVIVDGVVQLNISNNVLELADIFTVTTNDAGEITPEAVETALAEAIADEVVGFNPEQLRPSPDWMANLRLVSNAQGQMTDAVIEVSSAISQVYQFRIVDAGEGYTDPSFVFSHEVIGIDMDGDEEEPTVIASGAEPIAPSNIDVLQFGTRWKMFPDNSGVTELYTLLPGDIDYEYVPVNTGNQVPFTENEISDANFNKDVNLLNALEVVDGHIQYIDQITEFYATDYRSHMMPRAIIEEPRSLKARVEIDWIGVDDNGGITSFDDDVEEYGEGYTEQFSVTVEPAAVGAPGTGALVNITDGEFAASGEYQWDGDYEIKTVGSGYLQELNVQNYAGFNGTFGEGDSQLVFPGQTYFFNIQYGTGDKQVDVFSNDN